MKVYDVVFDEDIDEGVYSISVVGNPAMKSSFIALKEQNTTIQLAEVDKKERTLLGVVLIPDKEIPRNIKGEQFFIRFSKETIKAAAHAFLKNGHQRNSSLEHEVKLEGMSVVESWIVKDPNMDTANAYGLPKEDIKEGSFVVKMKCDNDDIYNKALAGEITGFSIDGLFRLNEINLKSDSMSKKTIKESLQEVLVEMGLVKKEVKLTELKLKDGKTVVAFEGEKPEVGKPVFILSGDEKNPLKEGEHELESGEILFVDKDGLVAEEVKDEVNTEIKAEMKAVITTVKKDHDAVLVTLKDSHKTEMDAKDVIIKALELKLEQKPAADKIALAVLEAAEPSNSAERLMSIINKSRN